MSDALIKARHSWLQTVRVYATPLMLSMLILGFASGLPLMMVFQKLSYWLRSEGIDKATIGFMYWVTIAYTVKWMWSPAVDRIPIPFLTKALGRRRSWMLVAIVGTIVGLLVIGYSTPSQGLWLTLAGAMILAYSGATLDIAIDAWRIESATNDNQANMAAAYVMGYRGAIMFAGFGLAVASWTNWRISFTVMAATMVIGGVFVLLMKEPARDPSQAEPPMSFAKRMGVAIVDPFKQFLTRLKFWIIPVFVMIAIYRLSDFTMGIMASPLYADLGYAGDIIGALQGGPGIIATVTGGFLGGFLAFRFGVLPTMVIGGLLTLVSNGAYAWLAQTGGPDEVWRVGLAIMFDNIAGGFTGTILIAYMSSLTDPANAATQYALLSSLYALVNKFLAGLSGILAEAVGYVHFFLITASYAIPATLMVIAVLAFGSKAAKGEIDFTPPDQKAQEG
ncbi:AmpG family muropeptide MFS transporter [Woodsholea maritima]|uniref:AmpG family muropeptide MFS transporter n=1 Tax=Woodsholea maritima TaxID=240237 RepID=UPI000370B268|nr:MFS transporter [Woodsholea maritima]